MSVTVFIAAQARVTYTVFIDEAARVSDTISSVEVSVHPRTETDRREACTATDSRALA